MESLENYTLEACAELPLLMVQSVDIDGENSLIRLAYYEDRPIRVNARTAELVAKAATTDRMGQERKPFLLVSAALNPNGWGGDWGVLLLLMPNKPEESMYELHNRYYLRVDRAVAEAVLDLEKDMINREASFRSKKQN